MSILTLKDTWGGSRVKKESSLRVGFNMNRKVTYKNLEVIYIDTRIYTDI